VQIRQVDHCREEKIRTRVYCKGPSWGITLRKRKIRKDTGKKKAKCRRTGPNGEVASDSEGNSGSEEDEETVAASFKSSEFVNDED
jgi:hypothetical protein